MKRPVSDGMLYAPLLAKMFQVRLVVALKMGGRGHADQIRPCGQSLLEALRMAKPHLPLTGSSLDRHTAGVDGSRGYFQCAKIARSPGDLMQTHTFYPPSLPSDALCGGPMASRRWRRLRFGGGDTGRLWYWKVSHLRALLPDEGRHSTTCALSPSEMSLYAIRRMHP